MALQPNVHFWAATLFFDYPAIFLLLSSVIIASCHCPDTPVILLSLWRCVRQPACQDDPSQGVLGSIIVSSEGQILRQTGLTVGSIAGVCLIF